MVSVASRGSALGMTIKSIEKTFSTPSAAPQKENESFENVVTLRYEKG